MSGSRRIPLSFYLVGLLILFAATGIASAFVVRAQAEQDAQDNGRIEAQLAAELASSAVAAALTQLEATVSLTAANPATASVFTPGSPCNVALGTVGVFEKTHLEFMTPTGEITCSSAGPTPSGLSYRLSSWLSGALRGAVLVAPVVDERTGHVSAVRAAPVGDRGLVAAFVDLTDLGTTLATRFGGPQHLEFVVTTPDGKTVLARSRPDIESTARIYGDATIGAGGWRVSAGAEQSAVVSSATDLFLRGLFAMSVGVLVLLIGTLLVYRRVVGPIHALSNAVAAAKDPATAQPAGVSGPAEIARLAENFNELMATVTTQLVDRHHAEAAARAMLDASLDAVVGMDQQGKIVEWSLQAEATFGWTKAEAIGQPLVSLIVPDRYRARHTAGLAEHRRTGAGPLLGRRIELEACTRDGREIPVELAITPVATPAGHVFTAFIRDLSTRRSSEEERHSLEARLRQSERLEGIGRLAGGIAHDFNNILAVVMNYSQFVEDTLPADSPVRDDVVQIRLAAERGATFTRQLLTFAHRGAVTPQDVQLNTVLRELQTMLRRTIPASVKIELQLAPDLWTARIDVGQLEQLVLNLIVNAADAMPEGGTVLVETANVEIDAETSTQLELTSGRYVRLEVIDTGYGMSKEVIARAFEPFFTTKPRGKGTGLGLATAYGVVRQAQGAISIHSVVGKGTTLRVHLPAQVGVIAEAARIRVASVANAAPSKATVFVVEDEAAVRKSVIRILSDRGYGVLQAAGPSTALDVATMWSGPVDLLLTDIVMPDMSGDELARELRKARPDLRVVYMTGYTGALDVSMLRLGGTVIHKPFTRDALLAMVEEALAETS